MPPETQTAAATAIGEPSLQSVTAPTRTPLTPKAVPGKPPAAEHHGFNYELNQNILLCGTDRLTQSIS